MGVRIPLRGLKNGECPVGRGWRLENVLGVKASGVRIPNSPQMEDCQSGLLYLFAKEMGVTAPQVRILYLPLNVCCLS